MMTILDYCYDDISIILSYALFYGGCIGSSMWMGSGLGCGVVAMDNVLSCLGGFYSIRLIVKLLFLFCSLARHYKH